MSWSKIKAAINSTLGLSNFKPLDKIITDGFDTFDNSLKSGDNDYIANRALTADVADYAKTSGGIKAKTIPIIFSYDEIDTRREKWVTTLNAEEYPAELFTNSIYIIKFKLPKINVLDTVIMEQQSDIYQKVIYSIASSCSYTNSKVINASIKIDCSDDENITLTTSWSSPYDYTATIYAKLILLQY